MVGKGRSMTRKRVKPPNLGEYRVQFGRTAHRDYQNRYASAAKAQEAMRRAVNQLIKVDSLWTDEERRVVNALLSAIDNATFERQQQVIEGTLDRYPVHLRYWIEPK